MEARLLECTRQAGMAADCFAANLIEGLQKPVKEIVQIFL